MAEAGGRLDETGACGDTDLAGPQFFRVGQQAGLQDHLDQFPPGAFHYTFHIKTDLFPVSRFSRADVHHHVDFVCAPLDCQARFIGFHVRLIHARRKTNHRADPDRRVCQFVAGQGNEDRRDADGIKPVLDRFPAQLLHHFRRGVRREQGMVDDAGDRIHGLRTACPSGRRRRRPGRYPLSTCLRQRPGTGRRWRRPPPDRRCAARRPVCSWPPLPASPRPVLPAR